MGSMATGGYAIANPSDGCVLLSKGGRLVARELRPVACLGEIRPTSCVRAMHDGGNSQRTTAVRLSLFGRRLTLPMTLPGTARGAKGHAGSAVATQLSGTSTQNAGRESP